MDVANNFIPVVTDFVNLNLMLYPFKLGAVAGVRLRYRKDKDALKTGLARKAMDSLTGYALLPTPFDYVYLVRRFWGERKGPSYKP